MRGALPILTFFLVDLYLPVEKQTPLLTEVFKLLFCDVWITFPKLSAGVAFQLCQKEEQIQS